LLRGYLISTPLTATTLTATGGLRALVHLREEVLAAHLEARLNQTSVLVSSPEHDTLNVPGTEVSENRLQHPKGVITGKDLLNGRELGGSLTAMDPQLISGHLLRVTVNLRPQKFESGVLRWLSLVVLNESSNSPVEELLHGRRLLGLPPESDASVRVCLQGDEPLRGLLARSHSPASKPLPISVTKHGCPISLERGNDSLPLSQSVGHEVTDVPANGVEHHAVALIVEVEVKNDGHLLHYHCPFLLVIGARVDCLACDTTIGMLLRRRQALNQ
jgi:hypothetical protein